MKFVSVIQGRPFGYTVYGICALLMAALAIYTAAKLFFVGSRKDRLDYLKNYKKGQFIFIYLIAIPLYFTGLVHLADFTDGAYGMRLFECFLRSIDCALSLVGLDFGMGGIFAFMRADAFYAAAVISCFLLTIFNVVLFTASLLWQRAMNFFRTLHARASADIYVAIGGNEDNICLLKSVRAHGKRGILFALPDAAMRDELYIERIPCVKFSYEEHFIRELGGKLQDLFGRQLRRGGIVRKNVTLIINTGDSKTDLLLTQEAYTILCTEFRRPFRYSIDPIILENAGNRQKAEKNAQETISAFDRQTSLKEVRVTAAGAFLRVYVYGELSDKAVYADLIENSEGHIDFLNRYELAALEFVKQYPFTHFMTDAQLDYERGVVREGWDLNVCFIGFGPTNKQIFLRMVSDAQMYAEEGGNVVHKKVNYHFFDRQPVYMDKNFNHTYNRYTQTFLKNEYVPENYLPLPAYPANDGLIEDGKVLSWQENSHFHCVDINDYRFLEELRAVLFNGRPSYNYIIVSFGEDLEDIDFAKRIRRHLDRNGLFCKTYLFAKVRDKLLSEELMKKEKGAVIPFGCSADSVFDIIRIAEDPIRRMAQYKSFSFPRGSKEMSWKQRYERAIDDWSKDNIETQQSNFYACLNLRLRLNLLGFDYVPIEADVPDAKTDFWRAYFGTDDEAQIDEVRLMFDGEYDEGVYTDGSKRTFFAIQEHQRWNVYQISCGFIPIPLTQLYAGEGKDEEHLRHGCLTEFDSLVDYRKALNGENDTLKKNEKRKYDYKILDIADEILHDTGFKLIKRCPTEEN